MAYIFSIPLLLLLLVLRRPEQFTSPTFIHNDGLIYFKYAFEHSWLDALFRPHNGYLNLYTNTFSVVAAKVSPLAYAPHVMLLGGCLMWLVLVLLISSKESPFTSTLSKLIATLLTVVASSSFSSTEMVYSLFFTPAVLALILVLQPESETTKKFYRVLVVLCGLIGPTTIFMIPLFFRRFRTSHSNETKIHLHSLIACMFVQLAAYSWSMTYYDYEIQGFGKNIGLSQIMPLDLFVAWVANHSIIKLGLGLHAFEYVGESLEKTIASYSATYFMDILGCCMASILLAMLLWGREKHTKYEVTSLFTCAFFLILVLNFVTAYPNSQGSKTYLLHKAHRYLVAPSLLMGWILVLHAEYVHKKGYKWLYCSLVGVLSVVGVAAYFPFGGYAGDPYGPHAIWKDEVALWQKNPDYALNISPTGSRIQLKAYQPVHTIDDIWYQP